MDPWIPAMIVLGVGLLIAAGLGALYARSADNEQLRRWAREDGLAITDRARLKAHYRARQLW